MLDSATSTAFELRAIDRLRDAGHRVTMPRILVIRALAESNRALSAQAVHERVTAGGGRMDIVSVYRTLSTLLEAHLIHHVGVVDGYMACGVEGDHGTMTEHLVCQSCGVVTELQVDKAFAAMTEAKISHTGFRPHEVKLEVLGTCGNCQK